MDIFTHTALVHRDWQEALNRRLGGVSARLEGRSIRTSPALLYQGRALTNWDGWVPCSEVSDKMYSREFCRAGQSALLLYTDWLGTFDDGSPYWSSQPANLNTLTPAGMLGLTELDTSYFVTLIPLWMDPSCFTAPPVLLGDGLSWELGSEYTPHDVTSSKAALAG